MTTTRPLDDRHRAVVRQLRALLSDISNEDPDELSRVAELQHILADGLGDCVRTMRDNGHDDAAIGDALGVTRSAVSRRWPGGSRYVGAAGRYRTRAPA